MTSAGNPMSDIEVVLLIGVMVVLMATIMIAWKWSRRGASRTQNESCRATRTVTMTLLEFDELNARTWDEGFMTAAEWPNEGTNPHNGEYRSAS